jgi:hypothetical protein
MDVTQGMLDVHNTHDLEHCLTYFVPDITVENAEGQVAWDGRDAVWALLCSPDRAESHLHLSVLIAG